MQNSKNKILGKGAEAIIYLENTASRVGGGGLVGGNKKVIKDRIAKSYRIPELDNKIRKQRTKAEAKILEKASKIIDVPKVLPDIYHGRLEGERSAGGRGEFNSQFKIKMQFIDGKKLSSELDNFPLNEQKQIMKKIGESVAKLHIARIIHGDLTTSNMIYKNKKVFFIDFGLGFQNGKIEDKGVDIHLLKQALEAKHFKNWKILFSEFEKSYKKTNKQEAKPIFERLSAIEKRGRYRN